MIRVIRGARRRSIPLRHGTASCASATKGDVMSTDRKTHRAALLAGCAIVMAIAVAPRSAQAGCNSGDVANTDLLSSANCEAAAPGNGATAVGTGASASGQASSAYGVSSTASGLGGSAYGFDSTASGISSSAYGVSSTASGNGSSAYGTISTASGTTTTAFGDGGASIGPA